jgi:hypothetical protein
MTRSRPTRSRRLDDAVGGRLSVVASCRTLPPFGFASFARRPATASRRRRRLRRLRHRVHAARLSQNNFRQSTLIIGRERTAAARTTMPDHRRRRSATPSPAAAAAGWCSSVVTLNAGDVCVRVCVSVRVVHVLVAAAARGLRNA